ncbi:helix-turn-helix domain-containing protein [Erwinia piriflorinigrans]|uniref:Type III secretion system transcriptional regulator invF n=1 Tax=Erwinia piriflorinigrans CFBP 5888 TaxID=1161919 RepID=V5Z4L4_9GAMM|nr:helix-turn-helix domain-containing protein [Erwinia piriflorinigrans]CCG86223.1 Type III secretion system transcriptional regulator invF [Erwinia piriflorinigrans CFBP 5888]
MNLTLENMIEHYKASLNVNVDKLIRKNIIVANNTLEVSNSLIFANPVEKDAVLELQVNDTNICGLPVLKQSALIASIKETKLDVDGGWSIEVLPIPKVAILLSFIDYHFKSIANLIKKRSVKEYGPAVFENSILHISLTEGGHDGFMRILTDAVLNRQENNLVRIAPFIRNLESYWLAYFLLSQAMGKGQKNNNLNIYNACKTYGVSESQFRNLCHDVFSRGPKKQLCLWRAARSALQLIDNNKSVAVIAHMNGYASSSHFASELKSLFGITPREFKKIESFLNEDTGRKKN